MSIWHVFTWEPYVKTKSIMRIVPWQFRYEGLKWNELWLIKEIHVIYQKSTRMIEIETCLQICELIQLINTAGKKKKKTVRAYTSTTILNPPPSPELSKWRRLQRGERHIPLTLQSPQGPIWLEGGKGFNLGLIQLLLKWKFLPVRTSGVQSEDLHTDAHKAQRSQWEAQPRICENPSLSPSSCRASLLHD